MLMTHQDLLIKMNELESKVAYHDKSIKQVFTYIRQFLREQNQTLEPIGFKQNNKE